MTFDVTVQRYGPSVASDVPSKVKMFLPRWLGGGAVVDFMASARLDATVVGEAEDEVEVEVETFERRDKARPDLVLDFAVSAEERWNQLSAVEAANMVQHPSTPLIAATVQRLSTTAPLAAAAGLVAPGFVLHQAQTHGAPATALGAVAHAVCDDLRGIRLAETNEPAFPNASVHFMHRHPALMHRMRIPAVLMRVTHDERLQAADISHLTANNAAGELIFASSGGLGDGTMLLDAYLAPFYGAATPFVWGFPVMRASGTIMYSLGRLIAGTAADAVEPLQLLPARGAKGPIPTPEISSDSVQLSVRWWARRLDKLLSVLSDPAVHSDTEGNYIPSKHLHAILTVEQLFRRTASIQRAHRDGEARRVLLFTVLDTLERVTTRPLTTLCNLSFARQVLKRLRSDLPGEVGELLLPAAERAATALESMQDGFFLRRQLGTKNVEFTDAAGSPCALDPIDAVAEYVKVLRNATHGHGSNREERKVQTDALLAHHTGAIPHDLALLGYLYLLEVLTKPDLLRRTLYVGGRV